MAEKISEFTCLVRDMREAQKLYFDTRGQGLSEESKGDRKTGG